MDPGWKPAVKGLWRYLIPAFFRRRLVGNCVLLGARTIVLITMLSWFAFGVILSFLDRDFADAPAWVFPGVAGAGLIAVALIFAMRARPLPSTDPQVLRDAYLKRFFVGYALSDGAVLIGFVAFFLGGRMAAYLVGVPFGLAGIYLTAPTRRNLDRLQVSLRAAGSTLSVVQVLNAQADV